MLLRGRETALPDDFEWFSSREQLQKYLPPFSPKPTNPSDGANEQSTPTPASATVTELGKASIRPNIVLIVLESFATEHTDAGDGPSYTPNLDQLASEGHSFTNSFANGRSSIAAIPSLLAGLPNLMDEPFITSAFQTSPLTGLATILGNAGYETAFLHGGHNGTMFFDLMARLFGFQTYVGADEYPDSEDDDGRWGIFDEPFLQYSANYLSQMTPPFFATIFTLSSHHPYTIPVKYEGSFPKGDLPIHQSIGYADYALGKFFEAAKDTDWFGNTVFILTGDHTSKSTSKTFNTEVGRYRVPIIVYSPKLDLPLAPEDSLAQHVDIPATILDWLDLDDTPRPKFGRSLARSNEEGFVILASYGRTWLLNRNRLIQLHPRRGFETFRWRLDRDLKNAVPLSTNDLIWQKRLAAMRQYYFQGLQDHWLDR